MKKRFTLVSMLLCLGLGLTAQSFLIPAEGYKAIDTLKAYSNLAYFDIHDNYLYACDGDTIRRFYLGTGAQFNTYVKPADYTAWPSFLTINPDGTEVWAGFTVDGNTDDRIYRVDLETGTWDLKAVLASNFDLAFRGDSILVAATNSTNFGDPNKIFLLDTTGNNAHRAVIETGGNSTGLALDGEGTLYCGTSFMMDPNMLLAWSADTLDYILSHPEEPALNIEAADKLSDLPAGTYDCELDSDGNVLFNLNPFSSDKVIAMWNGTAGDGSNFDTLALATGDYDWLANIKAVGSATNDQVGNHIYVTSFGQPIGALHADHPPYLVSGLDDVSGVVGETLEIDLNGVFADLDDDDADIIISVKTINDPSVVDPSISNRTLFIDLLSEGSTAIVLEANSNNKTIELSQNVMVGPNSTARPDFSTLRVYPNPTSGAFRIALGTDEATRITLTDLSGREAWATDAYHAGTVIDIGYLPAGVYLLKVSLHDQTTVQPVVKR